MFTFYTHTFPSLVIENFNFAHAISKRGGRTLARLRKSGNIEGKKLACFHSLRHTFINQLAQHGIDDEMRGAIVGQKHGGIDSTVYTKLRDAVAPKVAVVEIGLNDLEQLLDDCCLMPR